MDFVCNAFLLKVSPAIRGDGYLLDFLTNSHGRLAAYYLGNAGEKNACVPLAFNLIELEVSEKKYRYCLRRWCTSAQQLHPLLSNNRTLACSYYLNELLYTSLQYEESVERLFDLYHQSLVGLSRNIGKEYLILRAFERALLEFLGLAVEWQFDANGDPIVSTKYYYYGPCGFSVAAEADSSCFAGNMIKKVADTGISPETAKVVQIVYQAALRAHTGINHFKSREYWRSEIKNA